MEYIYLGASVECAASDVISKNIRPGAILNVPELGLCRKYSCDRNSEVFNVKELNPKKYKINKNSHLNLNDSLQAESIVVFVNSSKTIDKEKCPYTGRHNTQYMSVRYFTHAYITKIRVSNSKIKDVKQIAAEKKSNKKKTQSSKNKKK